MNVYERTHLTGDKVLHTINTPSTALMCPVVEKALMIPANEWTNDTTKSGKQKGAMYVHTEINGDDYNQDSAVYLIVAKGSAPKDSWATFKAVSIAVPF